MTTNFSAVLQTVHYRSYIHLWLSAGTERRQAQIQSFFGVQCIVVVLFCVLHLVFRDFFLIFLVFSFFLGKIQFDIVFWVHFGAFYLHQILGIAK